VGLATDEMSKRDRQKVTEWAQLTGERVCESALRPREQLFAVDFAKHADEAYNTQEQS